MSSPGHVITAFLQLHHGSTVVTPLPTCLFRCFQKSVGLLVLGAIFCAVPSAVAKTTNLCLAPTTFAVFSSVFFMYISWFDPFTAPTCRTIDPILGRIFLEFQVPLLLEVQIE